MYKKIKIDAATKQDGRLETSTLTKNEQNNNDNNSRMKPEWPLIGRKNKQQKNKH